MTRARDIANFGDGIATADIDDGAVTAGKLNSTLDLTGKTVTLPAGVGGAIVNIATASRTSSAFETTSSNFVDVADLSISYTMQDSNNKLIVYVAGHFRRGSQNGGIASILNFDNVDIGPSAIRSSDARDDDELPFGTAHIDGYAGAKTIKARVRSIPGNSKAQVSVPVTLIVMEYTP